MKIRDILNMEQIEKFCDAHTSDETRCDYRYSIPVERDSYRDIKDYPIFETLLLIENDQSIITLMKIDDVSYQVVNIYDEDNNFTYINLYS